MASTQTICAAATEAAAVSLEDAPGGRLTLYEPHVVIAAADAGRVGNLLTYGHLPDVAITHRRDADRAGLRVLADPWAGVAIGTDVTDVRLSCAAGASLFVDNRWLWVIAAALVGVGIGYGAGRLFK